MAWVAEENFNSLSDGDLNGQGGGSGWSANWSGGTNYDVQGSTVYEGAKAVQGVNANQNITRALTTAVSAGVVYWAMRCNMGPTGDAAVDLKTGGNIYARIQFRSDGGSPANILVATGTAQNTIVSGFSNIWYVIELTIISTSSFSIRVHNGTSWSSSFGPYTSNTTGSVDTVQFNSGGDQTLYVDTFTATDPTAAAGPANLKSYNTNLKANIKSINTNLIANVKSLNTNT